MSIPKVEQIFGYEQERKQIEQALKGGVRQIALTGGAGAGKTYLFQDALSRLQNERWLIGAGKHASGDTSAAPLLSAIKALIDAALEELYEPEAGLHQLRQTMGPLVGVFDEVFQNQDVHRVATTDVRVVSEQIGQVVILVLEWLSGFCLPIVLIIDDWDRAGAQVGAVYTQLPDFIPDAHFCLLTTGRTWPSFAAPTANDRVSLALLGLDQATRCELLCATLGAKMGVEISRLLPDTVLMPFDLKQRAQEISNKLAEGHTINDPQVLAVALRDDLSQIIFARFATIPEPARNVARVAAVMGDATEGTVLKVALGLSERSFSIAISALKRAAILESRDTHVAFPHDTIRSALLDQMSGHGLEALFYAAAERLLPWVVKGQEFQAGLEALLLALHRPLHEERWIKPALVGARRASRLLEFSRAQLLAQIAVQCDSGIEGAGFETLEVLGTTSLIQGNPRRASDCSSRLRALAVSRLEIATAYSLSAISARAMMEGPRAVEWAIEGYARLGWSFSKVPEFLQNVLRITWTNAIGNVSRRLARHNAQFDREILALSAVSATIFFENSLGHTVELATRSALDRSTCNTAAGLSAACFVANLAKRYRLSSQLGHRAVAAQVPFEPNIGTTAYRAHFFGRMWTVSARSFEDVHEYLFAAALSEGDAVIAAWVLRNRTNLHWRFGGHLDVLQQHALRARAFAVRVGDAINATASDQSWLAAQVLKGQKAEPTIPIDPNAPLGFEAAGLTWLACYNLQFRFDLAEKLIESIPQKLDLSLSTHPGAREFQFHRAVVMLARKGTCWREDIDGIKQARDLCPDDNAARHMILQALRMKVRGKSKNALEVMAQAGTESARLQRPHEASLAWCFASEIAASQGLVKDAQNYHDLAARAWSDWGAAPSSHGRLGLSGQRSQASEVDDLRQELERLARESRAKSRLLALVGHELRTPLQAMAGAYDLMNAGAGDAKDQSIVADSMERLTTMIDDLSDISALESGDLGVNPRAFDLNKLLRQIIQTHAPLLKANGQTLALAAPSSSNLWLIGDDKRLLQILDNLLTNARKYGAGEVHLQVTQRGDVWHFSVKDEGNGLTPEQALKVFEPFVRGSDTGNTKGHGIGLWLARKLAGRMNGSLDLVQDEVLGSGAEFCLSLPMITCAQKADAARPTLGETFNIILIEDEPLSHGVLSRMLSLDGHHVTGFLSPLEALKHFKAASNAPDLILLDFNMPGLSGLGLAREVRAIWGKDSPKIILVTAQMNDEIVCAQSEGLIDDSAQKPLNLENLRALIGVSWEAADGHFDLEFNQAAHDQLTVYIDQLHNAYEREFWEELESIAHKLLGAASLFDLFQLMAVAAKIERLATQPDKIALSTAFEDLGIAQKQMQLDL